MFRLLTIEKEIWNIKKKSRKRNDRDEFKNAHKYKKRWRNDRCNDESILNVPSFRWQSTEWIKSGLENSCQLYARSIEKKQRAHYNMNYVFFKHRTLVYFCVEKKHRCAQKYTEEKNIHQGQWSHFPYPSTFHQHFGFANPSHPFPPPPPPLTTFIPISKFRRKQSTLQKIALNMNA